MGPRLGANMKRVALLRSDFLALALAGATGKESGLQLERKREQAQFEGARALRVSWCVWPIKEVPIKDNEGGCGASELKRGKARSLGLAQWLRLPKLVALSGGGGGGFHCHRDYATQNWPPLVRLAG